MARTLKKELLLPIGLVVFLVSSPAELCAGGSGLNVVVVANGDSPDSCELANYYCRKREIAPERVLKIAWQGSKVEWTDTDFNAFLVDPLLAFLAANELTNQVQYVVLSMDIPYRVTGSRPNSTTSALFYGFKPGTKDLTNSYAGSEARFKEAEPTTAPGYSFLTMMLTAGSLAQAKRLVDQGIASDQSFPESPAWLAKSSDPLRNVRYRAFDNAVFNARLASAYSLGRTNLDSPWGLTGLMGFQTGLANFGVSSNAFLPGAIADSFSSFGGQLFEASGQTSLLSFIHAGASASYGTVTEPQPVVKKFPDPQVYFYQSRGYSIAESYYQSIEIPLEGLLVGEPLAAPFRRQFSGGWMDLENGALLRSTTNLALSFFSGQSGQGIESVDLFVDGKYRQTLTNLPPEPGNRLTVRLNGYEVSYAVPTNATLRSIATELANLLNDPVHTNFTKVLAVAHGDRIELQYFAPLPSAGTFEFVDLDATTNTPRTYLAAVDRLWSPPWMTAMGRTANGGFRLMFGSTRDTPATLYASSDLSQWQPVYTNFPGGLMEFVDTDAGLFPKRFYRLAVPAHLQPPQLTLLGRNPSGEFRVRATGLPGRPYLLQASPDLRVWSDILTNLTGGDVLFADPQSASKPSRFYRTRSGVPSDYSPVSVVGQIPSGGSIVRVQSDRPGDSVVWASTNSVDWFPIYRHAVQSVVLTATSSDKGSGTFPGTTLQAARSEFLTTTAYGLRRFSINTNAPLQSTDFLTATIIKTNGHSVTVSVTNQTGLGNLKSFVQRLIDAVNNRAELVGLDGVTGEDLVDGNVGAVDFNLRARAIGREAAAIQVTFSASTNLNLYGSGTFLLDGNLSDLRPRNYLLVGAGRPAVALTVPLDTTQLDDGHHELTAVAYEGTSVHTQTRRSVTVIVSNTPLHAQFSVPTNALPSTTNFPVTVTANSNSVNRILLYTTGGLLQGVTNQSAAAFFVNGQSLGAGEHPFYAIVTTASGQRYRTETQRVTLVRP
ncbi:MAG TPA: TIGR03790 family protein [Verrucomicrobiae bacterium]|nr:TIGR03790 family protein [Verrucomicrobiae bacterium]